MTIETIEKNIHKLKKDDYSDEKEIFEALKKLSEDSYTLDQTKKYLSILSYEDKKLIKENVAATIQRKNDIERTTINYITTFIVAILFSGLGAAFGDGINAVIGFLLMTVFLAIVIFFAVKDYTKQNTLYHYKIVKFIEDLDTSCWI